MILFSLSPIKRSNALDGHTVGSKWNEMKYFVPLVAIGGPYHPERTLFSAAMDQLINARNSPVTSELEVDSLLSNGGAEA